MHLALNADRGELVSTIVMSINPLAIDLKKQLGWLQERLAGSGSQHLRALQNASSRATFLATLSRALLEPSLTTPIVHAFRPILIDLCSRWLENGDLVEEKLEALCLLVQTHEELFPYAKVSHMLTFAF